MIRSNVADGSFRKSFRVDFFHSMRKAIALETFLELRVRNGFLIAALSDHRQIIQILLKFFVIFNRQNDGGLFAFFIC